MPKITRQELQKLGHAFYGFYGYSQCAATLGQIAGEIQRSQVPLDKKYYDVFIAVQKLVDELVEQKIKECLLAYSTHRQESVPAQSTIEPASGQSSVQAHSGSIPGKQTDSGWIQSAKKPPASEEIRKE